MADSLSSSDTAPLSSVIICCTTVTTRITMSRGWMFTLWARTNWSLRRGSAAVGALCFSVTGRPASGTWSDCGWCCGELPRSVAAKETPGAVRYEESTLPDVVLGVLWGLFFRNSSFAKLAWCGFSPSSNLQLQHAGVDAVFSFSGHSLYRCPPSHHKQRIDCLQFAQTWPNCWQLLHCVRALWDLYTSTLIARSQRLGRWKMSCDFALLDRVMRKKGRFVILDISGGNRRLIVIYLTLTTSKSRLTSPLQTSSSGVFCGR
jgi:hypothetical protein